MNKKKKKKLTKPKPKIAAADLKSSKNRNSNHFPLFSCRRTQVLHFVSAFRTIFFSEMQRTRKSLDLQNFQARRGQNMGEKNPYLKRKTVEDYDTAAKNSRYCIRS